MFKDLRDFIAKAEKVGEVRRVDGADWNLEIGLMAQGTVEGRRPDRPLRLVLRCFDPELARRIHAVSDDYTLLSEAMIAAPFFVRTALSHTMTSTPDAT